MPELHCTTFVALKIKVSQAKIFCYLSSESEGKILSLFLCDSVQACIMSGGCHLCVACGTLCCLFVWHAWAV